MTWNYRRHRIRRAGAGGLPVPDRRGHFAIGTRLPGRDGLQFPPDPQLESRPANIQRQPRRSLLAGRKRANRLGRTA